jgi:hypothetical protein
MGYWLRRHRQTEALTPSQLARRLEVGMEGLALLSLCRTPRDDHFHEDLAVICRRAGAKEAAVAHLLRQEQALAQWAQKAPPPQGWLMAASDAASPESEEAREDIRELPDDHTKDH